MNTQMSYSSTMPAPPPDEEPSEWQQQQPQTQAQPENEQQQYYYMPDQPPSVDKSNFFDGISKQVLFLIFFAFVVGIFVGKSMNGPIVIHRAN
jgi:hypothetical protein